MTTKKRRQRGNSTHGHGSRKNNRGAGHRGGRGNAGSDKHEMHDDEYEDEDGFVNPCEKTTRKVSLQKLDEDVLLGYKEGKALKLNGHYLLDARDYVEDGYDADQVRVTADGQVRNDIYVISDYFSENAAAKLDRESGEAIISGGSEAPNESKYLAANTTTMDKYDKYLTDMKQAVNDGSVLDSEDVEKLLDIAEKTDEDRALQQVVLILDGHFTNKEDLDAEDVVDLFHVELLLDERDLRIDNVRDRIEEYLSGEGIRDTDLRREQLRIGLSSEPNLAEVRESLRYLRDLHEDRFEDESVEERRLEIEQRKYLFAVDNLVQRAQS